MPSEHSPAETDDRERFPDIRQEIGEDPARWLDARLMDAPDRREMVKTRIFSIDFVAVAEAWIEVETELERGPRQQLIAWLNQRLAVLDDRGDRQFERDELDLEVVA